MRKNEQLLKSFQNQLVQKYTCRPLTSQVIDNIQIEVNKFLRYNNIRSSVKLRIDEGKFNYMEIIRARSY